MIYESLASTHDTGGHGLQPAHAAQVDAFEPRDELAHRDAVASESGRIAEAAGLEPLIENPRACFMMPNLAMSLINREIAVPGQVSRGSCCVPILWTQARRQASPAH